MAARSILSPWLRLKSMIRSDAAAVLSNVDLYFATGTQFANRIGAALASYPIRWNTESAMLRVELPDAPPAGATHLIVVADAGGALPEASETNNVLATPYVAPGTFAGLITSGGSLANLTGLLTARNVALGDVWATGLSGRQPAPVLVVHSDIHYSVMRAAGILGLDQAIVDAMQQRVDLVL